MLNRFYALLGVGILMLSADVHGQVVNARIGMEGIS